MKTEAKEDKYLVGELEGKIFIKFVGNCTMKNSKTLEELFNKIFAGDKKELIFDFEECNYMDSTMLGLIAKTSIKTKKTWQSNIYAINMTNSVLANLKSTGVDKLLEVVENCNADNVELEKLETKNFDSKEEKTVHILEAHKTLMSLSEENQQIFQNVVNLLEKELNK